MYRNEPASLNIKKTNEKATGILLELHTCCRKGGLMTQQTHLGNTIDAVDSNKVLYDKNVKELLADAQILARILKYTVAEVRQLEIDEIISCIDTDSIAVGTIPIAPGLTNAMRVQSVQTEDSVLHESYITFDIRLSLTYGKKSVRIIINLEAQKSADVGKLGYHLENRIIYYMARLVSSQKETEFFHSDYDNLKKVYSIWICMDGNKESVRKVSLVPETIYGDPQGYMNFDKMCGIIIQLRRRKHAAESKNKLIAMLEDLLCQEDHITKKKKLAEKYGMQMTVELERRLNQMCNLSDLVEEEAMERGIERGIEVFILDNLEEHVPKERIIVKLQKRFQLEQSRAEEYFDAYAPAICR